MSKFFAKVKNNLVLDVIVADQNFINSLPKEDGVIYVESTHNVYSGKEHDKDGNVIADNRQMNTAVKGGFYNQDDDIFYDEQPHPSWILNTDDYGWDAPIPEPDTDETFYWDEVAYQTDNTKGWQVIDLNSRNDE